MNMRTVFSILLTCSLSVVLFSCSGGSIVPTSPTTSGCESLDGASYLDGSEATCCCTGSNAKNPAPASCSGTTFTCPMGPAGLAATAGSLNDAAQAYNAGLAATGASNALLSSSAPAKNSAPTAGTSAATAGGVSAIPNPATLPTAVSPISSVGGISGGGSARGISAPSGNSGAMLASTPTAPATDTVASNASAAVSPSEGAYVSGGAGTGRADLFGLGADTNNVSPGSGKADSKEFEGARAPANAVMASADPADYFTLLNSSDNIFKIVERKYTDKSKQWALTDAEALAGSARTAPAKK